MKCPLCNANGLVLKIDSITTYKIEIFKKTYVYKEEETNTLDSRWLECLDCEACTDGDSLNKADHKLYKWGKHVGIL